MGIFPGFSLGVSLLVVQPSAHLHCHSLHMCVWMLVWPFATAPVLFIFFFFNQHFLYYEPLKRRIQLIHYNAIFITHSAHFYKTDVIHFTVLGRCVRHVLKGRNVKALHFLWRAFTRPVLTVGLHPIRELSEQAINYPPYRCIDWSTDCLYPVKHSSNVNAFISQFGNNCGKQNAPPPHSWYGCVVHVAVTHNQSLSSCYLVFKNVDWKQHVMRGKQAFATCLRCLGCLNLHCL